MQLSGRLTLNPSKSFAAFDEWAELQKLRGKSGEQVLRKLMTYWISFAIAKIPAGNAETIRADLMTLRRNYKPPIIGAKGKAADRYRGTIAAMLVQRLNWKNANSAKNKRGGSAFYGKVPQFINARVFSRNVHKAGFKPTLAALRAKSPDRTPNYGKMPGTYEQDINDWSATLIAENYASSAQRPGNTLAPLTIVGLAGDCLSAPEPEVARQLEKWLAEDLIAAANRTGFFAR